MKKYIWFGVLSVLFIGTSVFASTTIGTNVVSGTASPVNPYGDFESVYNVFSSEIVDGVNKQTALAGIANTSDPGNLAFGVVGNATSNGDVNVDRIVGSYGVAYASSTITDQVYAFQAYMETYGDVLNLAMFDGESASNEGGGTVTNAYGLRLPDMTIATNNYAIKTGLGKVIFGDNVGIGTTTPASRLHVTSGASATTTVTIGEIGLNTSKGCVNMNKSNGAPASFYINAGNSLVVESNYCR